MSCNSIIYQLNQCERDAEQIQRRLSEIKAKLGTLFAPRNAHNARSAREAGARVPINLNSININSVCDTSAAEAVTHTQPISLGGLFRQLPKRVPESYALWWWRSMKERFFGKAFPRQEETAAEEWDLIFDK